MISDYLDYILTDDPVINGYYQHLYSTFNPNITGFLFVFMLPPHLSGATQHFKTNTQNNSNINGDLSNFTSHQEMSSLLTYAAADHTPPQTQITSAQISPRTGGVPYATDVTSSENCSITFVDNMNCSIYLYHLVWVEYIRAISNGGYHDGTDWVPMKPSGEYLDESGTEYGALDYATSIYVVKYKPDMRNITYIGKSIGCIPSSLPSKENIGSKTSNELAMLPFDYTIGAYREYVYGHNVNKWLFDEVMSILPSASF